MIGVSIICNTYNHGKYIRNALDSFISQKTTFDFEILLHDDASTDDTAQIIHDYELKYPKQIRSLIQKENQYSQGVSILNTYQLPRAKGKYIAFCEGDDYWIDEYKLQKQFDALENNPLINICTCRTMKVQDGNFVGEMSPTNTDAILLPEQVITGGGAYVGTNSIMLRKEEYITMKEMYLGKCSNNNLVGLDYFIQIIGSLPNGMLYLNDCMCAYRVFSDGSWTQRMKNDSGARIKHEQRVIDLLHKLDETTGWVYQNAIRQEITKREYLILLLQSDFGALRKPPYYSIYKSNSLKSRCKIRMIEILNKIHLRKGEK